MLHSYLHVVLLVLEGQMGEVWEMSEKQSYSQIWAQWIRSTFTFWYLKA
jgi:hypothetical protein